ncbi:hypothetical protein KCP69_13695 [Salmonella enterica subsp. enterica]|nr:hypothetical protein KCP69_13695 [Salmonella enterica subsp. enterica]
MIVGMSGGVGPPFHFGCCSNRVYQVEGLFAKNWEEDDECEEYCTAAAIWLTRRPCATNGIERCIPLILPQNIGITIFELFLEEYKAGRTPKPGYSVQ